MRMFILGAAIAAFAGTSLAAMNSDIVQYGGSSCKEVAISNPEGVDVIIYACTEAGKPTMYTRYQEGTRMSIGFGTVPNVAEAYFLLEREANWPVQWLGERKEGAFIPRAAIARFYPLDGEEQRSPSILAVFRLLENGMSCITGVVRAGPHQNRDAVAVAEESVAKKTCAGEATRLQP